MTSSIGKRGGGAGCAVFLGLLSFAVGRQVLAVADLPTGARGPWVEEVLTLLQTQVADWNKGDLEAFCAYYAEDAVFFSPKGVRRGSADILKRYQQHYQNDKKGMGELSLEPLDVRASKGRMIAVGLRWRLVWKDQTKASGLALVTFERKRGQWKIVQDASM